MMKHKNNELLIIIAIGVTSVAVISSLYRIGVWYQQGGYEIAIIYNISKIIFMINTDIYIFKKKFAILFLTGFSLFITIIIFILLYNRFTSNGLSNAFFQLVLFIAAFLLCIWDFIKERGKYS